MKLPSLVKFTALILLIVVLANVGKPALLILMPQLYRGIKLDQASAYFILISIGLVIFCANLLFVYKKTKVDENIRLPLTVATSILSVISVVFLYAFYKDLMGIGCSGFMGVSTSCTQEALFQIMILGRPALLVGLGVLVVIVITSSIRKSRKEALSTEKNKKSQKVSFIKWRREFLYIGFVALLLVGFVSNLIPFTYNMVRCGRQPVESSKFMAAFTYKLPGDEGYGIHLFSEYRFCTEAEIKATNGYHRDPWTSAGKKEKDELRAKRLEAQKFSPSKVNYSVYFPEGYEIEKLHVREIKGNVHTFYIVVKDGKKIAVRELKKDNDYNICNELDDPSKKYCKTIGQDSQGREVKREYFNGFRGWYARYAGANIGDTGIIISTDNDQDAIDILGAMKIYQQ